MKKSFLILGVLASICATDAYARKDKDRGIAQTSAQGPTLEAQESSSDITISCPKKECHIETIYDYSSYPGQETTGTIYQCYYPNGKVCGVPKVDDSPNAKNIGSGKTSRAAHTKTVVPQKVVYKEIYFDDSVDEFEEE